MERVQGFSRYSALFVSVIFAFVLLGQGITKQVPFASVSGKILMAENNRALPKTTVYLYPAFDTDQELDGPTRPAYAELSGEDGTFQFSKVQAGEYFLSASANVHRIENRRITIREGVNKDLDIKLDPVPPYLNLQISQRVFLPTERANYVLEGFIPDDEMKMNLYRLSDEYLRAAGFDDRDSSIRFEKDNKQRFEHVKTELVKIENRDVEGVFRNSMDVSTLPLGCYLVEYSSKNHQTVGQFMITDLALAVKSTAKSGLAYVTNLATGEPVEGVSIFQSSKLLGKTDQSGLLQFTPEVQQSDSANLVFTAEHNASRAVLSQYVYGREEERTVGHMITDRPIYKPGDTILFKAILRERQAGGAYAVPRNQPVSVVFSDYSNRELDVQNLQTDDQGAVSGAIATDAELPATGYQVEIRGENLSFRNSVILNEYRKADYSIKVTPEKKSYLRGERVRFFVDVTYYTGAPVIGAQVNSYAELETYYGPSYSDEYSEGGYGGMYLGDQDAITDENGRAVIEVDTQSQASKIAAHSDFLISLQASVTDASGDYFDGSGATLLKRGEYGIELTSPYLVGSIGKSREVTALVYDVETKKPLANQKISATVGYYLRTLQGSQFKLIRKEDLVSDSEGRITLSFVAGVSADHHVTFLGSDRRNNQILAEGYVWIYGGDSEYMSAPEQSDFQVSFEKDIYRIGETANLIIRNQGKARYALVTMESDTVSEPRVVSLKQGINVVPMTVKDQYLPNISASVLVIHDKKMREQAAVCNLGREERSLNIEITPQKEVYQPGETATYQILTRDPKGNPVPADLSFALVDEAIFAVREDSSDILKSFYPDHYNGVRTSFSAEVIYLDGGDKGDPKIELRDDFRDTAFWKSQVRTDGNGRATVTMKLPDNLTSWRATCVGFTEQLYVGKSKQNIISRKPLMVRLDGPELIVKSDKTRVSATVTNNTGRDDQFEFTFALVGGSLLSGEARVNRRIKDGETISLEWLISAERATQVKLIARCSGGGATDGVQLEIPVIPNGPEKLSTESRLVVSQETFPIEILPNSDRNYGYVSVELEPSLETKMLGIAKKLIEYPFGCVEQTSSKLVALAGMKSLFQSMGTAAPMTAAELNREVAYGVLRLMEMRNYQGGWGWWKSEETSVKMTAIALEAISVLKDAGLSPAYINPKQLESLMQDQLKKAPDDFRNLNVTPEYRRTLVVGAQRDLLQLVCAASPYIKTPEMRKYVESVDPKNLDAEGLTYVVMYYHRAGKEFNKAKQKALDLLFSKALITDTMISWPTDRGYDNITNERALQALVMVNPKDQRVQKILNSMRVSGEDYAWNTYRSGKLLQALSAYLKFFPSKPSGEALVTLNGKPIVRCNLADVYLYYQSVAKIPLSELKPSGNVIAVNAKYVVANVKVSQVAENIEPVQFSNAKDIEVTRTYHKMDKIRLENGNMSFGPIDKPSTNFNQGDLITVRLKVSVKSFARYVAISDYIPAGFYIYENGITENSTYQGYERKGLNVNFFSDELDKGEHIYEYTVRAEQHGEYAGIPAKVYNMYEAGKVAYTRSDRLVVRP